MMYLGGMLSAMGDIQYRGGNLLLFEYPHGTEYLHNTYGIPHMYHNIPTVLKLEKMICYGTEHPTVLMITPHTS